MEQQHHQQLHAGAPGDLALCSTQAPSPLASPARGTAEAVVGQVSSG